MHSLIIQISGLVALLIFANQLWHHAPLDKTIFTGITTGLAVYLALILGEVTIRRILTYTPPPSTHEHAGDASEKKGHSASGPKPHDHEQEEKAEASVA